MIRYIYSKMLERANEMEEQLPALIQNDDWQAIKNVCTFPTDEWDGPAATNYHVLLNEAVNAKNNILVSQLPAFIRKQVDKTQRADHEMAERIRKNFSSLF